jgi:branched-chain amino acid transport system ATP-binding protein
MKPNMQRMLQVTNISKKFNGLTAVNGVSLDVSTSEIVCLTGNNGAGKTTLFNLITGFESVDQGLILFKGAEITKTSARNRSKMGILRLFQTPRIFKHLTVKDNILAAAKNHPGERIENYLTLRFKRINDVESKNRLKANELIEFCGLKRHQGDFASNLSFGQKKLLSLSMLLMNDAELLLLDEIYSGINRVMIQRINNLLVELSLGGKTFIVIEHRVNEIMGIASRVLTMEQGQIL